MVFLKQNILELNIKLIKIAVEYIRKIQNMSYKRFISSTVILSLCTDAHF